MKRLSDWPEHYLAALLFTVLSIAFGIVGEMDYQEELRIEAANREYAELYGGSSYAEDHDHD
tara:strand:- start:11887 stop:12072 length:186 start_codon:yes stop_codon:yes gene_type:complete